MPNPYAPPDAEDSDEPTDSRTGPPRRAAMAFILVTMFIDILGIGIVIPVIPELVKEFVQEDVELASFYVGVIGSSYALTQFLFSPFLGALSDRFGRRPILLASMFGLGVDFVIQGLAPGIGWLFAGRLIAGVMGASFTTAHAYIADVSTPENRAQNFGLAGVMFGLGFIYGPALGGILGAYHLRLPFFVSAALALANWLYGYYILPESLPPERRSEFRWQRANPIGSLKVLGEYRVVAKLMGTFVFLSLAQRGLENVWVLFTGEKFGWSVRQNGLALGLVGLMAVIVQGLLVKPVIARFGEQKAVIFGLAIQSVIFTGYGLAPEGWMVLGLIMVGSLGGIAGPAIQSIVAGEVEPWNQGKVQGGITSLISLTNIVAPFIFTTVIFRYFTSDAAIVRFPGAPLVVGGAFLFIAMLIARGVFRQLALDHSDNVAGTPVGDGVASVTEDASEAS